MEREKCKILYTIVRGKTVARIDSNGTHEIYVDQLDKINRKLGTMKPPTNMTVQKEPKRKAPETLIPLDDYISL